MRRCYQLAGGSAQYYNNLGYSYMLRGNLTVALTNFRKAKALDAGQRGGGQQPAASWPTRTRGVGRVLRQAGRSATTERWPSRRTPRIPRLRVMATPRDALPSPHAAGEATASQSRGASRLAALPAAGRWSCCGAEVA